MNIQGRLKGLRKMTNEEKMKQMNRKELTKFLCGVIYKTGWGCDRCSFKSYCDKEHNGVYVWLGKEVNEK